MYSKVADKLLENQTITGIQIQSYVNDIILICRSKYEGTQCDIIQTEIRRTTSTLRRRMGLHNDPAKATIVPFTRKRNPDYLRDRWGCLNRLSMLG